MASYEIRGKSIRGVVRVALDVSPTGKLTRTFDNNAAGMRAYEDWAAKTERKKELDTLPTVGASMTAGELFEAYEDVAGKTDTGKWNILRLRKWQKDPIAKLRIGTMVTHDIDQWIARCLSQPSERTGEPLSAASVVRELNLMSGCFNWAVKVRKWIKVNPCHECARPIGFQKARKPKALTPKQIEAICVATGFAHDPQLRTATARVGAAWLLALETGMRSGEILRLKPEHYWRKRKTAWVAAEEKGGRKSSRSGRATVDPSRHVPLTQRAIELLDLLVKTMPKDQDHLVKYGMTPPYIVGVSDSLRDALWRKARTQAGLAEFTFHDSKHEACTRLAPYLDPVELSHAIGTKDIRLLRDTYYIADASRAAARLPASLMAPVAKPKHLPDTVHTLQQEGS